MLPPFWPHSTMGWPENTDTLKKYYPTSVLVTSRDIITLWVARMVLFSQENMGTVPFHTVYIHPKILDGNGQTMSKSKGNGVDPMDIEEKYGTDALRFVMASLCTDNQDVQTAKVELLVAQCFAEILRAERNRVLVRPHRSNFCQPLRQRFRRVKIREPLRKVDCPASIRDAGHPADNGIGKSLGTFT